MRRAWGSTVALASLALVAVVAAGPATAFQSGIDVRRPVGFLSTVPGRIVEEILTVVNLSGDDYNVTGTLDDLTVDSNGTFSSVPTGSGLPSAATWGVVEPATFLLPHGHTQTVRVAFKPPTDVEPRGYYATLSFAGSTTQGAAVRAIHPVLLDVDGPGVLRAGTISSASASSWVFGSTAHLTLSLENSGNVYALAGGRVTVRDMLSRKTAVVTVPKTPVLPGTTRILKIDVPTPMVPGRVRVTTELGFGPGVPTDSASVTLIALAWWHLGAFVVLLLILLRIAVALVRHRRRRRFVHEKMKKRRWKRKTDEEPGPEVPVALPGAVAADLQSSWEPSVEPAPPKPAPPIVVPPSPKPVLAIVPPPADEPAAIEPEPEPEPEPVPRPEPPAAEPEPEVWSPPVVVPIASSRPAAEAPPPAADYEDDREIELWPEPRIILRPKPEPVPEDKPLPEREPEPERKPQPVVEPRPVAPVSKPEPVPVAPPRAPQPLLHPLPPVPAPPRPAPPAPPVEPRKVAPVEPKVAPVEPKVAPVEPKQVEPEKEPVPVAAAPKLEPVVEKAPPPVAASATVTAVAAALSDIEQPDPAPARAKKLSDLVRAGIPEGPPAGPHAAARRVKVAIDLLASGSGKSAERLDVALQIIASAGNVDAITPLEQAFEDAASSKRSGAMGPLALGLDRLKSPRAPQALLRAYAVSPRAGSAALRDALKACDPAVLKAQRKLLAALPADRRAALKLA